MLNKDFMELIVPFCRDGLSASDKAFVAEALTHTRPDHEACLRFLQDPEERDSLLDGEALFTALIKRPEAIGVSSRLYFYILVRRVFREASLLDRDLADYIASLLAAFSEAGRAFGTNNSQREAFFYAVDIITAAQEAPPGRRFALLVRLADRALFLTGLYPEHVAHRERLRAAPGMRYYEGIGQTHYRQAGTHYIAQEYCLDEVYGALGERFGEVRRALNRMAEHLTFLGSCPELPGMN